MGRALQIILEVHSDGTREQVIHDCNADVVTPCLDTVESKKLWQ